MLVAHAAAVFGLDADPRLAALLGWAARLAVVVFFVFSGFVIALAVQRGSMARGFALWPFVGHRAARILPPYLAAVAITAGVGFAFAVGLVSGPPALRGAALAPDGPALLRALTLTYRAGDPHNLLDGPIWSLRLEVGLYAVAGLFGLAAGTRGWARALALVAALGLLGAMAARLTFGPAAALLFGLGALAAWRAGRGALSAPFAAPALAAACLVPVAASTAVTADLLAPGTSPASLLAHLVVGGLAALLILDVAANPGGSARLLARAAPLGGFAYTLYVVHAPLLALARGLHRDRAPALPDAAAAALAICVTLALALGLARFLERPARFRRLGAALLRRVRPAPS